MFHTIYTDTDGNAWIHELSFFSFDDAARWVLEGEYGKPRREHELDHMFILDTRAMIVYGLDGNLDWYVPADVARTRYPRIDA